MSASLAEMRERAARKAQEESAIRQERLELLLKRLAQNRKQQEEDEAAWVVLGDELDEWEMIETHINE